MRSRGPVDPWTRDPWTRGAVSAPSTWWTSDLWTSDLWASEALRRGRLDDCGGAVHARRGDVVWGASSQRRGGRLARWGVEVLAD